MMKLMGIIIAAFLWTQCRSETTHQLKDVFLQSPADGQHQVVYLEDGFVYRVFCGQEHQFTTETLTRKECTHTNPQLRFEKLDYELQYKPRLKSFLELQNPETLRTEINYLRNQLKELNQRLTDEAFENVNDVNYRSRLEEEIKAIKDKLAVLEPQMPTLAVYEAIVGSSDQNNPGLLHITQKYKDYVKGYRAKAILAPFGGTLAVATDIKREYSHNGVKFTFKKINSGFFLMGSPPDEPGRKDDERQHEVIISKPFFMQTTEVTREQYRAIMGYYPEDGPDRDDSCYKYIAVKQDNHPVSCVSWDDAKSFIKKLNQIAGKDVYRLPTEAEWEYATRCGTTGPYSKDGVKVSDESLAAANIAWFKANSGDKTHPVGLLEPNPCGLYDVHGNVTEWMEDAYQENYPDQKKDPIFRIGARRVGRGGDFLEAATNVRSATRIWGENPNINYLESGFRLVRTKE